MSKKAGIIFIIVFAVTALFGFKEYEQTTSKETMTVIVTNRDKTMLINISISGGNRSFEQKSVTAESKYDYSDVLNMIKNYQENGWHIKASNYATSVEPNADLQYYLYFLLEK